MKLVFKVFNADRFELSEKKSWKIANLRQQLSQQDEGIVQIQELLKSANSTLNELKTNRDNILAELEQLTKE